MYQTYTYVLLNSFLAAVLVFQVTTVSIGVEVAATLIILFVSAVSLLLRKNTRKSGCLLLIGVCAVSVAALRCAQAVHTPSVQDIDFYAHDQKVKIEGWISAEPDRRPDKAKYEVDAEFLTLSGRTIPVQGTVLVTDHRLWPTYEYGDRVAVVGVLQKPGVIDDFDYGAYLAVSGIYSTVSRASLVSLGSRNDWGFWRGLFAFKRWWEARIASIFAEPQASFLAGLLTGSRRGMPEDLVENFQQTGLTHIVAVSGSNITIVATVLAGLLGFLPLTWRWVPICFGIALFAVFTGASASVVRAAIMGILGIVALRLGRSSNIRLTMLWTASAMVFVNPLQLLGDAGFQLSFLSLLGLAEFSPALLHMLRKVPEHGGLREALACTLAAQLATLPVVTFTFGRLSLIAPVANVLAAPAIPFAMLWGFVATLFAGVPVLGVLTASVSWLLLQWIIEVATVLANIPGASIETPGFLAIAGTLGAFAISAYVLTTRIPAPSAGYSSTVPVPPAPQFSRGTQTHT